MLKSADMLAEGGLSLSYEKHTVLLRFEESDTIFKSSHGHGQVN